MKKRTLSLLSTALTAAISASMLICAVPVSAADNAKVVLNGEEMSLDDLIKNAQKEGNLQSVGMPDDWANWKGSWEAITDTYGISHGDVDMTSAEELSQFAAEKDDPTKDIGDIGLSMTPEAIKQDVIGTYKASTWDSFPDWAKDPDGHWCLAYTGTVAFIINKELVKDIPRTWSDLLKGTYRVSVGAVGSSYVSLNSSPVSRSTAKTDIGSAPKSMTSARSAAKTRFFIVLSSKF